MKNRIFVTMLVVVIISAFVSYVYPQEANRQAKKTSPAKTAPETYKASGKVSEVNLKNYSITIISDLTGIALTMLIDKNASFSKKDKNIELKDIKKGDFVVVVYETRKGRNVIRSLVVQDKKNSTKK